VPEILSPRLGRAFWATARLDKKRLAPHNPAQNALVIDQR